MNKLLFFYGLITNLLFTGGVYYFLTKAEVRSEDNFQPLLSLTNANNNSLLQNCKSIGLLNRCKNWESLCLVNKTGTFFQCHFFTEHLPKLLHWGKSK